MAKKKTPSRKPSGAAAISTVEELEPTQTDLTYELNGNPPEEPAAPKRTAKPKSDQSSAGNFGVSEIKKAAAFVNSVGGLDQAMTLLQILKVAKEVQ